MINGILTALKFTGVLISGIAGFIGTLPSDHHEQRKNRKGIWRLFGKQTAVRWVIIGAAVAVVSQFAETVKNNQESRAVERSKAATTAAQTLILSNLTLQTSRQQQSLSYIERILAPLDPPKLNVKLQLTLTNASFETLREYLKHTWAPPSDYRRRYNNPASAKYVEQDKSSRILTASPPSSPGAQGILIQGRIGEIRFADEDDPGPRIVLVPLDIPRPNTSKPLIANLPKLKIELFSKHAGWFPPNPQSRCNPDLIAIAEPIHTAAFYDRLTGEVFLQMSYQVSTNWQPHLWLSAVPDLDNADCCITPIEIPAEGADGFHPVSASMDFGRAAVTVTNFERLADGSGASTYHSKLPAAEAIALAPNFRDPQTWESTNKPNSSHP